MRTFIVVVAMVVAMCASVHARITADDAQAIAEATANAIEARGGCAAEPTLVVDPASSAPTYVTGPKVFQACKLRRNGECKPTRTFFKAVE